MVTDSELLYKNFSNIFDKLSINVGVAADLSTYDMICVNYELSAKYMIKNIFVSLRYEKDIQYNNSNIAVGIGITQY
jgi:hypothetical protein